MDRKKIIHEILDISKIFVTAFIFAFAVNHLLIVNAEVPTGSMEETISTGSHIIINRLAYKLDEPERGDIVDFLLPDDGKTPYLKRIIGLPGETVEGISGQIYIDGAPLLDNFTDQVIEDDFGPYSVPENCYFMMGDNRNNSWDSRFWTSKFVEKDAIIGKAEFMYYPQLKMLR